MDAKSLSTWAKAKASTSSASPADALEPGLTEGTVRHPFQVANRDEYKKNVTRGRGISALTHDAPVVDVPLSELTGIQRTVNRERLAQHLANPNLIPPGTRGHGHGGLIDQPVVVKSGGQYFLHDGHHRATAAHLRGQQSIKARVIDLDKE